MITDPLAVPCPKCGRNAGEPCADLRVRKEGAHWIDRRRGGPLLAQNRKHAHRPRVERARYRQWRPA